MTAAPQVLQARVQANRVRAARTTAKRELAPLPVRDSRVRCAELVTANPPGLRSMPVAELVRACPKTGPQATRAYLEAAGIGELATVGGLTVRQRLMLAGALRLDRAVIRQAEYGGRA